MAYVMKREAFGKALVEQPVVRNRLAKAGAELETLQAWLNEFLWQMNHLPKSQADTRLGGLTALVKAKAGMVFNECAQTGVMLFGGNGFTETGQGELVAHIYRDVFGARIPGGSEDVMVSSYIPLPSLNLPCNSSSAPRVLSRRLLSVLFFSFLKVNADCVLCAII